MFVLAETNKQEVGGGGYEGVSVGGRGPAYSRGRGKEWGGGGGRGEV